MSIDHTEKADHAPHRVRWFTRARGGAPAALHEADCTKYVTKSSANGCTIPQYIVTQTVRMVGGSVRFVSANLRQDARVDPCYISTPNDLRMLRTGFRIVRDITRQKAMNPFGGEGLVPGKAWMTDRDIDEFIRKKASTVQDATCTCRMGKGRQGWVRSGAARARR